MKIDPRSDRVALHYQGDESGRPFISGVPARDLTENDIARLVTIAHGQLRGAAHQAAVDALVDRLAAGPYRRTPPAARARGSARNVPAPSAAATTPPVAPEPSQAEPSAATPKEA